MNPWIERSEIGGVSAVFDGVDAARKDRVELVEFATQVHIPPNDSPDSWGVRVVAVVLVVLLVGASYALGELQGAAWNRTTGTLALVAIVCVATALALRFSGRGDRQAAAQRGVAHGACRCGWISRAEGRGRGGRRRGG